MPRKPACYGKTLYIFRGLQIPIFGTSELQIRWDEIALTFDGLNHSNDVFYNEDVTATCIDFNNMNRLYQREKRLIFEDIPSNNGDVLGYIPIYIELNGVETPQNHPDYITHENTIIYAQRLAVNIASVGEIQDLMND